MGMEWLGLESRLWLGSRMRLGPWLRLGPRLGPLVVTPSINYYLARKADQDNKVYVSPYK